MQLSKLRRSNGIEFQMEIIVFVNWSFYIYVFLQECDLWNT